MVFKDYFIGFLNLDTGRTGHAEFTEINEAEAISAFKECYRHHKYKILCCVAYREYRVEIV